MAREIHSLIERLRALTPEVRGAGELSWGARGKDHRSQIRESLRAELGVEDLEESPPRPADWSVSISHSRREGGWLAVPRPFRIGFDVEELSRIQPRIIERTCTPQEIAAAPNPAYLWSAKEAYYKALEHEQPEAMTQISIDRWSEIEPGIYEFRAKNLERGILIATGESTFAACLIASN
jgi:hypothetical protein